jgi:hypothetical protein
MMSSACSACLDDERCWVCLGTGLIDTRSGVPEPCLRCFASGDCSVCQTITIDDVSQSLCSTPSAAAKTAAGSARPPEPTPRLSVRDIADSGGRGIRTHDDASAP